MRHGPRFGGALTVALFAAAGSLDAQALPSPESVLGFEPGADYELADYEQSVAYFPQLAAATDHSSVALPAGNGRQSVTALNCSAKSACGSPNTPGGRHRCPA